MKYSELLKASSMEARQNLLSLQLIIRNSSLLRLLPRLLQRCKLSHSRDRMISPLKLILSETFTLQKRRVNSLEHKIVLSAGEIQKTKTVYVTLILRRNRYLNLLVY